MIRRIDLILFSGMTIFSLGCSSPGTPYYNDRESYEAALLAYDECMQRLYPASRGGECDRVMANQQGSHRYDRYDGRQNYGGGNSPTSSNDYYRPVGYDSPSDYYGSSYNSPYFSFRQPPAGNFHYGGANIYGVAPDAPSEKAEPFEIEISEQLMELSPEDLQRVTMEWLELSSSGVGR